MRHIFTLKKISINQYNIDKEELEFLRLNLIYSSHKCQTRKLFSTKDLKLAHQNTKNVHLKYRGKKTNE